MVPAQRFQLADQLVVMAKLQVRFDPVLDCHDGQLVEMGPLGVGEAGIGELGQWLAAPQPKSVTEHGGRPGYRALSAQASPFGDQGFESGCVEVSGTDIECVAGFGGDDGRGSERSAQLGDLGLQRVGRLRRLPLAPELVDQTIGADRIPPVERQESQESPLLGTTNRYRHTPSDHLELAEELHVHAPTVRPMTRFGVIGVTRPPQGHVSVISGPERRLPPGPRTSRKGSTMIEATHLTKRYGKTVAVNEVSFSVKPGQVTGFLGPNGAGKSTTMRMILGLDAPTSGEVRVDGKPYHQLDDPLRSVGALLDAKAIVGGRSAANHLTWLADSNGISRRRVSDVLDIVGLSDVAGRKVGTFSLGMHQRLGIAAALLGDPETVMFDEPINGLDPEGIVWIRNLMKSLASEGRTVFLSSHLMSEMAQTAEHLIVIGRGRIIADASTDAFIDRHTAPSIRVRAVEQTELAEALTQRGALIERGSDGVMVVTGLDAAAIGGAARAHDITLLELAPLGSSLEEAYFDLTKDETDYRTGRLVDATKGA